MPPAIMLKKTVTPDKSATPAISGIHGQTAITDAQATTAAHTCRPSVAPRWLADSSFISPPIRLKGILPAKLNAFKS